MVCGVLKGNVGAMASYYIRCPCFALSPPTVLEHKPRGILVTSTTPAATTQLLLRLEPADQALVLFVPFMQLPTEAFTLFLGVLKFAGQAHDARLLNTPQSERARTNLKKPTIHSVRGSPFSMTINPHPRTSMSNATARTVCEDTVSVCFGHGLFCKLASL